MIQIVRKLPYHTPKLVSSYDNISLHTAVSFLDTAAAEAAKTDRRVRSVKPDDKQNAGTNFYRRLLIGQHESDVIETFFLRFDAHKKVRRELQLTDACFVVFRKFSGAKWFDVVAPDGEEGAVLVQSEGAWHFFSKSHESTASGSCAENCHRGGLGDALGTDSQLRTYKHLVLDTVPKPLEQYAGILAAQSQAAY